MQQATSPISTKPARKPGGADGTQRPARSGVRIAISRESVIVIPAQAQGCPGKSDISQSELVLNIERGLQGGWGFVEVGDGSVFEQTSAHQVCKAQCEQAGAAVARGDAQQQTGDHRGKDLQANGVFGTTEKGADFEMLLEPAKQQFDLPAFAIERGERAGRALEVVAQDGEQTTILTAQDDPAQAHRHPQALP